MNNNPSKMSNEDLEKDMEERNKADQLKKHSGESGSPNNQNDANKPDEKSMDLGIDFVPEKEQDLDELVHEQSKVKSSGTIPDPEELKFREG